MRIITPGELIDTELVCKASRSGWGDMLKANIEIVEYSTTMNHCKVLIIDNLIVSVGSTNFDNRSFRLNDEDNLNILDPDFAKAQTEIFEADWSKSFLITHDLDHFKKMHLKKISSFLTHNFKNCIKKMIDL